MCIRDSPHSNGILSGRSFLECRLIYISLIAAATQLTSIFYLLSPYYYIYSKLCYCRTLSYTTTSSARHAPHMSGKCSGNDKPSRNCLSSPGNRLKGSFYNHRLNIYLTHYKSSNVGCRECGVISNFTSILATDIREVFEAWPSG